VREGYATGTVGKGGKTRAFHLALIDPATILPADQVGPPPPRDPAGTPRARRARHGCRVVQRALTARGAQDDEPFRKLELDSRREKFPLPREIPPGAGAAPPADGTQGGPQELVRPGSLPRSSRGAVAGS